MDEFMVMVVGKSKALRAHLQISGLIFGDHWEV